MMRGRTFERRRKFGGASRCNFYHTSKPSTKAYRSRNKTNISIIYLFTMRSPTENGGEGRSFHIERMHGSAYCAIDDLIGRHWIDALTWSPDGISIGARRDWWNHLRRAMWLVGADVRIPRWLNNNSGTFLWNTKISGESGKLVNTSYFIYRTIHPLAWWLLPPNPLHRRRRRNRSDIQGVYEYGLSVLDAKGNIGHLRWWLCHQE